MNYSLKTGSLKGLLAVVEVSGSVALYAGLDALFQALDSSEEIRATGLPEWSILPILFAVRMGVNYLKVKRASPQLNQSSDQY